MTVDLGALTDLDPNALYIASLISETAIKQNLEAIYDQMRVQMGNKDVPKRLTEQIVRWMDEALGRHFLLERMRETRARLLTMHYTSEELTDLAAFYRSPIGRRYTVVEPKMTSELASQVMSAQMALMQEFSTWFEKVLMPDIEKGVYD